MAGDNYTRKSAKNALVSLISQIFTMLLNFISRSVFIHCLSAEYLGVNGLFSNVLTLLSFAELGIGGALVYAMYRPMKEKNKEKLGQLLSFYRKAYYGIALTVICIGFILSFFIEYLVAEQPKIKENMQAIFWMFLLNNALSYLLAYKQSLLMVDQKEYIVSIVRQIVLLVQICAQIALLYLTHEYFVYLICQLSGTLMVNVLLLAYVNKHYSWVTKNHINGSLDKDEKKKIFIDIKALSISKIAGVVSNGTDNLIIARLDGLLSVGIVSNYTMITNLVQNLIWNTLSGITGSIGNFNVDSSKKTKREVFNELFLLSFWIYGFVSACLVALLNPFITVWLGEDFAVGLDIVIALVAILYISGINFPYYTFRVTSGLFDSVKYNYVLFAVLNVVLSIILGLRCGLVGVYVATSISRLMTVELKEGKVVFEQVLGLNYIDYIKQYLGSFLLVILASGTALLLSNLITLSGWLGLIAKGAICVVSINAIFWIAFHNTNEYKKILERIVLLISSR